MIRVRDNNTKRSKTMYSCGDIPIKYLHNVKLKPNEKLDAVQRIKNGETKAAVARSLNIPESTLRGWFKNADRIERIVDRELFSRRSSSNGSNSPTLPGNVMNSMNVTDPFNNCLSRARSQPSSVKSTQSMSPPPYRPWAANDVASSMNNHGNNQLGSSTANCLNPRYSSLMATQSHSPPISLVRMVSPETKEESVVWIYDNYDIDKLGVPIDLRLSADSGIRSNPVVPRARTMSGNTNKDNNNNVTSTVSGNGEDRDNAIDDPIDALRNAEKFYEWFKTYSDPTLTTQDFLKFEDLLRRVKEITQRPANNPVQRVRRRK